MRIHIAAMVSAALMSLTMPWVSAVPKISEFMADPVPGVTRADEDGESTDWVELANETEEVIDLAGYGLSDEAGAPLKWVFPSRPVAPGERLVVFASGKSRRPTTGNLHTNFALDRSGEALVLSSPGGEIIDGYAAGFPPQRAGVSYGKALPLVETRLLGLGTPCRYRVPTGPLPGWQLGTYSDASWSTGSLAVGFDIDGDYAPIIGPGSDTRSAMYEIRSSAYVRVPFVIQDSAKVRALELRMKYDDGFVAFVNGVAVASRYMEEGAQWNSFATENRIDALNDRYETIDINAAIGSLVSGQNVLAIQGCNFTSNGLDFLIDPEVWAAIDQGGQEFDAFFENPTPGEPNNRGVVGFVEDTKFSANRGFFSAPFDLVITSATPGSTIRYTLDGEPPTAESGEVYAGPIRVNSSVTVRAAAYKEGHRSTDVDAHTYLFTGDIRTQEEMLPAVINAPAYSSQIEPGLRSLPVVALSLRDADFFGRNGIYTIATLSGRAQEVEVSFEFFDPADGRAVQAAGGIRIHGGNARSHPKKPLRLYFRGVYGDKRLNYPLFEGAPVNSFDQLVLRPGGHDSWSLADTFGATSSDLPPHATFMRDQFLRRTEIDLGMLSPRGCYVNLFINGQYWGLYDLHERPNAAFFADHLGGEENDYDVVHHPEFFGETHTVVDGSGASWEALVEKANSARSSEAYAEIGEILGIDEFIDHLIVRLWSGDYDWCGPIYRGAQDVTVFGSKNWYAGRRARGDQPGGFRLFCWDAEMSMGSHLMVNLTGQPVAQRVTNFDLTRANDGGSPAGLYDALRKNPAFRVRFGDRLQKHFFNDGAMTAAANGSRWAAMESEIQGAIIGESARWGHETGIVLTRDGHWRPEVSWVKNTFIPGRNATVLAQFRTAGLFPTTTAPSFSQRGGSIPSDGSFRLTLSGPPGATIYYTVDGTDPYVPPSADLDPLVGDDAELRVLVPSSANGGAILGAAWRELAEPANAVEWSDGINGVGYETSPENYAGLIRTDVGEMYAAHGSVFIRYPFEVADADSLASFEKLTLNMRYDDGFAAYINGSLVASANAPADPAYNSLATANKPDGQAVVYEPFDISPSLGVLKVGTNVLAIQGLNDGLTSSDLLIQAVLEAGREIPGGPTPGAQVYTDPLALAQSIRVKARARSAAGEWSPITEAQFTIGIPGGAQNLLVSEISYRPLGPLTAAEVAVGATDRGAFEFLEITNIAAERIDLAGVRFTAGIDFAFSGSAITSLGPGEQVVVVANRAAFLARYGAAAGGRVAGEFANQTSLNNGGENLELTAADGSLIQRFFYDDEAPWPRGADGNGGTLELIEPSARPNPGDARNWRVSLDMGGSPGGDGLAEYSRWTHRYFDSAAADFEQVSNREADPDGDGWSNAWEHLFALHPRVPDGDKVLARLVQDAGVTLLSIEASVRPGVDAGIIAETSSDLMDWSPVGVSQTGPPEPLRDGRLRLQFRAHEAISPKPQFLRLVTPP